MKRTRKPAQAAAGAQAGGSKPEASTAHKLTWREERFIWAYIDNLGNGALAAREAGYSPHCAKEIASEILTKPHILQAIETERERLKNLICFTREKALKILVGQATARASDFIDVLRDPEDETAYVGLAEKEFAIEAVKKSHKNGNEVKLISNSERRAIIDDLWEKLGLGKDGSEGDRISFLERFASIGARLGRSSGSGGSTSGEGSK